jgi:hypothetical protein
MRAAAIREDDAKEAKSGQRRISPSKGRSRMDERLDLIAENVKLRDAIEKALQTADPATRKKVYEIGVSQHDAERKGRER